MTEINNKKLCESCFSEIDAAETCPCCGYNKSEFSPDPMVLPLGMKLNDKIIIGRVMGKGGFGITYLGYDLRMDKTIAVKEYYPNGISYRAPDGTEVAVADAKSAETFENGAEKFYTEAEMVSQFNGNPNIVSVYDYFRANSTVYLIMEYLSGITLKNYVKRHGKLTDGQALYVMDKIVAALSITHSAGVLHRDISPDNIMICSDGKIKLIDFGAARQILTESSSNLTVVMKPGYTPIEQYTKKGKQGAWTDIYSLGVSMYYALTKVIIDDPYARIDSDEEFNENKYKINESLWEILKKCTMINASDRYGSAIDLRKALKSVSAPLTAEMIKLSAEDLKDEPEENDDTAAHTTAAPLDDDIPATVMGSDSDIAEEIEIFESGAPDESGGEPDTSDNTPAPVTVEEAKPSKKGKLTAAICSAAALVIVVVICLIIGLNSNKVPVDTNLSGYPFSTAGEPPEQNSEYSADYPEMIDGKLFFEMDSSYPENSAGKQISKDNLIRFDGDVKVTLELEHIPSEWDGNHIRITDSGDQWVEVMAFNKGINVYDVASDDYHYIIYPGQTEFTFVISRLNIDNMSGGLKFWMWNMFVKSAVLEAYDPAELEPGKDAVLVNINSRECYAENFIPLDILESFDSDVKITLDIEYEEMETDRRLKYAFISSYPFNSNGQIPAIEVENNSPMTGGWAIATYNLGSKSVPDKFIFTLPKSEIEKLDANGLGILSNNLYIKTAAVEKADKTVYSSSNPEIKDGKMTVKLDSSYPGAGRYSSGIPQSALEAFGSDVKITLDIERYNDIIDRGTGTYHGNIVVIDNHDELVAVNVYNMSTNDYGDYFVSGDKFVFSVSKESIASLGGKMLRFRMTNVFVKSAVIEKYDPDELKPGSGATYIELDSSYPGDYIFVGKMIPKSELEAFGGDVKITLYTERAVASEYEKSDGHKGTVSWLDPVIITKYGEDPISPLTIGDNLTRVPWDAGFWVGLYSPDAPKVAPETITFVLPQSEIDKPGQGLAFKTYGFYIKKAALEKA